MNILSNPTPVGKTSGLPLCPCSSLRLDFRHSPPFKTSKGESFAKPSKLHHCYLQPRSSVVSRQATCRSLHDPLGSCISRWPSFKFIPESHESQKPPGFLSWYHLPQ